jgi:hypothetical protein
MSSGSPHCILSQHLGAELETPEHPEVAAANASARGQRVAILASPLHELTVHLAADCLAP